MIKNNYLKMELSAVGENESFARSAVAAFALPLNPTITELSDIKTAVSEAVTNCIVHGYHNGGENNQIVIECHLQQNGGIGQLHITVTDFGSGIADVEQALMPFFTTLENDERSGMGFTIMQTFMDDFSIQSEKGKGTSVRMLKKIGVMENEKIKDRVHA